MSLQSSDPDKSLARNQGCILGLMAIPFGAIGFLVAVLLGLPTVTRIPVAIGSAIVAWVFLHFSSQWIARVTGGGIARFVFPRGDSTPYKPQFSYQDALAAKGDVVGALASYEEHLASHPTDIDAHMKIAELHLRAGDPLRAAALFQALRRLSVTSAQELYATQRLVDLYLGALGDRGRAIVELRRLVERFPGTTEGKHAKAAIARIKQELA